MNLSDTPDGHKRRLVIGGINSWDDLKVKSLNVAFYIEITDTNGVKLTDKSIHQDRLVVYSVSNLNWVDVNFNPVPEGTPGSKGEYEYFFELTFSVLLPSLITQLAQKLNERGLFN